ncbi:SprT family zinc-dependent metalloprotease [Lysobacter enzymogenes]|uniref:M48 family metallopeptidase n=1 Tax=Lysobacter enzymogenes TaxID=69 RepID=UPI0037488CF8
MAAGILTYGAERIRYEIVERARRKTLGIEVHPDRRVVVLAPTHCALPLIVERLERRAGWISRQLAMFGRYEKHAHPRHYLGGESHRYLGRQYRLKVIRADSRDPQLKIRLLHGRLIVAGTKGAGPSEVRSLLRDWYRQRAKAVFARILDGLFEPLSRMGYVLPRIVVREMSGRWGSLSARGQMTLNIDLVQAPKRCIEYVIAHELCHLQHRNHDAAFFKALSKFMPDWQSRKQKLEQCLL